MNLTCHLLLGSVRTELTLVQTPTQVTFDILENSPTWQEAARRYLIWVGRFQDHDLRKTQRRLIGEAWKVAEARSGRLVWGCA